VNQQSLFAAISVRCLGTVRIISVALLLCTLLLEAGCQAPVVPKEYVQYDTQAGFLLGPEDVLEITVWKNQDLSRLTSIRPDGYISMPIIGDVKAAGLTAAVLSQRIADRYKEYIQVPSVSVSVKELNSYMVFVLGEVGKPGKYQLKSFVTVLQAISLAGGFTTYARKNKLQVVRTIETADHQRQEIHIPLRYDDLVNGQGYPGNIMLASGDTLVVP
jgi:polysaccharide export outer membrane protein